MLYYRDLSKRNAAQKVKRYLSVNWQLSHTGGVVSVWHFKFADLETS
jgi:hypothetical protein